MGAKRASVAITCTIDSTARTNVSAICALFALSVSVKSPNTASACPAICPLFRSNSAATSAITSPIAVSASFSGSAYASKTARRSSCIALWAIVNCPRTVSVICSNIDCAVPVDVSSFDRSSSYFPPPSANCLPSRAMFAPAREPKIAIASSASIPDWPTVRRMSANEFTVGFMSCLYLASAAPDFCVPAAAADIAMRNCVPAIDPSSPRSRNCATLATVSSSVMLKPAPTVPANFIASRSDERSNSDERSACAKTSETRPDSLAPMVNCASVLASVSVASDISSPAAPARFSAGPVAAIVAFVSIPARASACMALAASVALNVVVLPRSRAVFVSASSSLPVAPETAATVVISCSNAAPTTADAAPSAAAAAVAA